MTNNSKKEIEIKQERVHLREQLATGNVISTSEIERKRHTEGMIPLSGLDNRVNTHIETDEKRAKLSKGIVSPAKKEKQDGFLKKASTNLDLMASKFLLKISGEKNLEKDIQTIHEFGKDEDELGGLLDKFEKVETIKDKVNNSFLGKISGFFTNKSDFNPEEFLDENGKMKRLGRYVKEKFKSDGVRASIGAAFVYGMVKKFEKPLLLYRPVKKIIEAIGMVVSKVEGIGSRASEFLGKFKLSREKIHAAQKIVTKAPKVISSFISNPKKQSGKVIEFLNKGNGVPGFAEALKTKKIKGFQFRGSGPAMIAILSQKVISEMIDGDQAEEPETFSQKWVPGVALFKHDLPNLISAIKEKGVMKSKTELGSFALQGVFDGLTMLALLTGGIAAVSGVATPVGVAATAGVIALRRAGLVGLRKLIGEGMKKYGKTVVKNKIKKDIIKKGGSFALSSGGPVALNYTMAAVIPKINEAVTGKVKTEGNRVVSEIFTPQQRRAYRLYKKMKS